MIKEYIIDLSNFPFKDLNPWEITSHLEDYIRQLIPLLSDEYRIEVLSPGILLNPSTIVKRLELVEQDPL